MDRTPINSTMVAALMTLSAGDAVSEDFRKNPLTLVYAGALSANEPGKVNIHPVWVPEYVDAAMNIAIAKDVFAEK